MTCFLREGDLVRERWKLLSWNSGSGLPSCGSQLASSSWVSSRIGGKRACTEKSEARTMVSYDAQHDPCHKLRWQLQALQPPYSLHYGKGTLRSRAKRVNDDDGGYLYASWREENFSLMIRLDCKPRFVHDRLVVLSLLRLLRVGLRTFVFAHCIFNCLLSIRVTFITPSHFVPSYGLQDFLRLEEGAHFPQPDLKRRYHVLGKCVEWVLLSNHLFSFPDTYIHWLHAFSCSRYTNQPNARHYKVLQSYLFCL